MSYAEASYIIDEVGAKVDAAGVGIAPANMQQFSAAAGDAKVTITALEPADTIIDGQLIASVKGFYIVMSSTGYPVDEKDGTVVANHIADGNVYTKEVTGLTNDQQYYFAAFPYTDHGVVNRAAGLRVLQTHANRATATPKEYTLYGFRINKNDSNPASRVEYLEQAIGKTPAAMNFTSGVFNYGGWENAFFMPKPYMVKSNGTLDYELDHDDQTKKKAGGSSDITNTSYDGNAMAVFPTIWHYCYESGNYEYHYICDIKINDNYKAYMHTRADGTIEDWHALSMFEGSLTSSKMRSLAGQTPAVNATAQNELAYATANGNLWSTEAFCEWDLIRTLLILMGKNTNAQAVYGYGVGGASAAIATGTLKAKPAFFGYSSSQSTTAAVKVFYMENWWGNIWNRIQGLIASTTRVMVKMTKPYNFTGSGFTDTGKNMGGTSGGYQNVVSCANNYGTIPVTASGSETTYECDGLWFNTSSGTYVALVGGCWNVAARLGFSCVGLNDAASRTSTGVGARLSCGQPAA